LEIRNKKANFKNDFIFVSNFIVLWHYIWKQVISK
jgi:hypothetical protein